MKTVRRPILEKGNDALLKFLRDKYVEGKDNIVEEWALEREKEEGQYAKGDY